MNFHEKIHYMDHVQQSHPPISPWLSNIENYREINCGSFWNKKKEQNREIDEYLETMKMREIIARKTLEIQLMMRKEYGMVEDLDEDDNDDEIAVSPNYIESPKKISSEMADQMKNDLEFQLSSIEDRMVDELVLSNQQKDFEEYKKFQIKCKKRLEKGVSILIDGAFKNKRQEKQLKVAINDHLPKYQKSYFNNIRRRIDTHTNKKKSTSKYEPSIISMKTTIKLHYANHTASDCYYRPVSIVKIQQRIQDFFNLPNGALSIPFEKFKYFCEFLFGENYLNHVHFYLWVYEIGVLDTHDIHISTLQISFFNQFRVETFDDYKNYLIERYGKIQSLDDLLKFLNDVFGESLQPFLQHLFVFTLKRLFKNKRTKMIPRKEYQRIIKMVDPKGIHLDFVLEFSSIYPPYNMISFDNLLEYFNWSHSIYPDLSNYCGVEDAWPLFFDKMVEWMIKNDRIPKENIPMYDN